MLEGGCSENLPHRSTFPRRWAGSNPGARVRMSRSDSEPEPTIVPDPIFPFGFERDCRPAQVREGRMSRQASRKTKIFIGSSAEGRSIARYLQLGLDDD